MSHGYTVLLQRRVELPVELDSRVQLLDLFRTELGDANRLAWVGVLHLCQAAQDSVRKLKTAYHIERAVQ